MALDPRVGKPSTPPQSNGPQFAVRLNWGHRIKGPITRRQHTTSLLHLKISSFSPSSPSSHQPPSLLSPSSIFFFSSPSLFTSYSLPLEDWKLCSRKSSGNPQEVGFRALNGCLIGWLNLVWLWFLICIHVDFDEIWVEKWWDEWKGDGSMG